MKQLAVLGAIGWRRFWIALAVAGCLAVATGLALRPGARAWVASAYHAKILGTPVIRGVARQPVDCRRLAADRRIVALAFGQSNAGNFADSRSAAAAGVYNFHEGSCYRAADPMLGADGHGGSVWPRVGDRLLSLGVARDVVFVTLGVSASSVADWAPGGRLHLRLVDAIASLRAAGLEPTHLLWHQGERDALTGTPPDAYAASFMALLDALRSRGVEAPIYVSVASYCRGRSSPTIASAQAGLVSAAKGIRAGPDSDAISEALDRHDGCHFSARGLDRFAAAWVAALTAPAPDR